MTDETANQGIPEPEGPAKIIETDYKIGQDNISTNVGPFGLVQFGLAEFVLRMYANSLRAETGNTPQSISTAIELLLYLHAPIVRTAGAVQRERQHCR